MLRPWSFWRKTIASATAAALLCGIAPITGDASLSFSPTLTRPCFSTEALAARVAASATGGRLGFFQGFYDLVEYGSNYRLGQISAPWVVETLFISACSWIATPHLGWTAGLWVRLAWQALHLFEPGFFYGLWIRDLSLVKTRLSIRRAMTLHLTAVSFTALLVAALTLFFKINGHPYPLAYVFTSLLMIPSIVHYAIETDSSPYINQVERRHALSRGLLLRHLRRAARHRNEGLGSQAEKALAKLGFDADISNYIGRRLVQNHTLERPDPAIVSELHYRLQAQDREPNRQPLRNPAFGGALVEILTQPNLSRNFEQTAAIHFLLFLEGQAETLRLRYPVLAETIEAACLENAWGHLIQPTPGFEGAALGDYCIQLARHFSTKKGSAPAQSLLLDWKDFSASLADRTRPAADFSQRVLVDVRQRDPSAIAKRVGTAIRHLSPGHSAPALFLERMLSDLQDALPRETILYRKNMNRFLAELHRELGVHFTPPLTTLMASLGMDALPTMQGEASEKSPPIKTTSPLLSKAASAIELNLINRKWGPMHKVSSTHFETLHALDHDFQSPLHCIWMLLYAPVRLSRMTQEAWERWCREEGALTFQEPVITVERLRLKEYLQKTFPQDQRINEKVDWMQQELLGILLLLYLQTTDTDNFPIWIMRDLPNLEYRIFAPLPNKHVHTDPIYGPRHPDHIHIQDIPFLDPFSRNRIGTEIRIQLRSQAA